MSKIREWENEVRKLESNTHLRKGQRYMVALSATDIDLYKKLHSTNADCFYQDEKCDQFLITLYTHYDKSDE